MLLKNSELQEGKNMKRFGIIVRILCLFLAIFCCLAGCNSGAFDETKNEADDTQTQTSIDTQTETTEGADENKTVITAMSFNVWGSNDGKATANDSTKIVRGSPMIRGPKLNSLLNGENIDIAGLQEVSARTDWVKFMQDSLDNKYSYIAAHTTDIESGVYIIYRNDKLEVIENGMFYLYDNAPTRPMKYSESEFQRICNWAIFKIKETGELFVFMDTHLDTYAEGRIKQVNILMSQIPVLKEKAKTLIGVDDCPVILVGDFNSKPGETVCVEVAKVMNDSLSITQGKQVNPLFNTHTGFWYCASTADYKKDGGRIDYVWVSKDNLSVRDYKMIHTSTNLCPYGEYISDHNAVIAQIEIGE